MHDAPPATEPPAHLISPTILGAGVSDSSATPPPGVKRRSPRAHLSRWVAPLLLVAACFGFVAFQVSLHNHTSPVDEFVYIDYLAKVPEQLVVSKGEETGQYARNYLVCNGVSTAIDPNPDLCDNGEIADSDVPFGGKSTADIYLPSYFATTWVLAQPISAMTGADLVTAGRLVGGFWLAGAGLLIFASLRRLGFPRAFCGAMPLFIVASLPAWWSTTYITTDATALVSGALMAYLLIRYLQTRRHGWTLVAAATVVVSLKLQNFAAVAVALLVVLTVHAIELLRRHRAGAPVQFAEAALGRLPRLAAGMALAPMILEVAWIAIKPTVDGGQSVDLQIDQPLGKKALLQESLKFVGSLTVGARDPSLFNVVGPTLVSVVGLLITGGLLGMTVGPSKKLPRSFAVATLSVLLTLGPALAIATAAVEGYYFPLPTRYGLSLMPFGVLCMAVFFGQNKAWRWILGAIAAVLYVSTYWLVYIAN
ncbi:hypothetical protein ACLRGF_02715 [Mycetocola zhadangensis]|uniref:hypothetical protein n=1 Tax=Mycetocola zhadangensis TaxID=1164595 RepID=UPI003A4D27A8